MTTTTDLTGLAHELEVAANGVLDAANEWATVDVPANGSKCHDVKLLDLRDAVRTWRAAGEALVRAQRTATTPPPEPSLRQKLLRALGYGHEDAPVDDELIAVVKYHRANHDAFTRQLDVLDDEKRAEEVTSRARALAERSIGAVIERAVLAELERDELRASLARASLAPTTPVPPTQYEVRGLTVVAIDGYGSWRDLNDGRFPRTKRGLRAMVRYLRARGYDVRDAAAETVEGAPQLPPTSANANAADEPEYVTVTLSIPERDTALAALRCWAQLRGGGLGELMPWFDDIAAAHGEPLSPEAIEGLADRLNGIEED